MRSSPRAQREAAARWRARESILRPAIRAAAGTARRIRADLVRGFMRRDDLNLRDLDALRAPLSQLLVASHLHSRLAARRMARGREIRFDRLSDQYSSTIDRITAQLEANPQAVRDLAAQYDEQARKTIDQLAQSLRGGLGDASAEAVRQGLTTRSAVQVIRQKLDAMGLNPASPRLIETIYRSQSALAFSAGQWNGNQDPAIDDILWGYEYATVGDDRVRPGHAALDGTRAPKNDPIWRTIFPPCGWNCRCFLPGTRVAGRFLAGSKARYTGPAVELETSRGLRLSVTANHPILTTHGWVGAGELREGHTLIGDSSDVEWNVPPDVNYEQCPAAIEDVFEAFGAHGSFARHPAALEFHGDARFFDGQIDVVVTADVVLRSDRHASFDRFLKFWLARSHGAVSDEASKAAGAATALALGPHCPHGLGWPADLSSAAAKNAPHSWTTYAEPVGERQQRLARLILLDNAKCVQATARFDSPELGAEALAAQERDYGSDVHPIFFGDGSGVVLATVLPQDLRPVGLQLGGRTLRAKWDSVPAKEAVDGAHVRADFVSDLLARGAGLVSTDEVRKIRRFQFSGHVYDLQSDKGWLLAGGIVASNCSVIEIFEGDRLARRKSPLEGGRADPGWAFNPGEVFRDALPSSGALVSR